ncbi:Uncharacterised protein [Neisseria animalis]|nr:Uncharacterised protein [Neisseria animalis]
MIQRCFALPYYVYCLRLRCLVSFLFYSTIFADDNCHAVRVMYACYLFSVTERCAAEVYHALIRLPVFLQALRRVLGRWGVIVRPSGRECR